uniref:F-box domain-containing protein n=1 Tax=Rhabditophanes sp. KR3021 TaxID=114890 RepID=A0AC35UEB3_9BILA
MTTLPCTSKSKPLNLEDMPNDCLLEIFKHLKRADVAKSKLISRTFNGFVNSFHCHLSRPAISKMIIQGKITVPEKERIGRIRFKPISKENTKRTYAISLFKKKANHRNNMISQIEQSTIKETLRFYLKKYVVSDCLRLENVEITPSFFENFNMNYADLCEIKDLSITLSPITITSPDFKQFLGKTSCQSLNIEFCENGDSIINDETFCTLSNLRKINIQLKNNLRLLSVSDKTLEHWQTKSNSTPDIINFDNCNTSFTLSKILYFIKCYQNSINKIVPKNWNFGVIRPTNVEIIGLSCQHEIKYNVFRCLNNDLQIVIELPKPLSQTKPNTEFTNTATFTLSLINEANL